MKQKIVHFLIGVLFIVSFGYFFGDQYWEYQEDQSQLLSYASQVEAKRENFSLESLESLEDMSLHTTPDRDLLDYFIERIDAAQHNIFVEVYIFTEKRMRDALIRAHNRGVEVKILLENNPYMAPYLNDNHFEAFQSAGMDVRWSDPLNYSLNHAKMLILDERVFISSGNFSYSLFTKNRDMIVEI